MVVAVANEQQRTRDKMSDKHGLLPSSDVEAACVEESTIRKALPADACAAWCTRVLKFLMAAPFFLFISTAYLFGQCKLSFWLLTPTPAGWNVFFYVFNHLIAIAIFVSGLYGASVIASKRANKKHMWFLVTFAGVLTGLEVALLALAGVVILMVMLVKVIWAGLEAVFGGRTAAVGDEILNGTISTDVSTTLESTISANASSMM